MPSTRSATSERPEENRQHLEEMAGTLQQESLTGHQMSWMTTIRDKLKREKESDSARRYRIGINDDGITTVSNIRDTPKCQRSHLGPCQKREPNSASKRLSCSYVEISLQVTCVSLNSMIKPPELKGKRSNLALLQDVSDMLCETVVKISVQGHT
ncbi:hypothetical protein T06_12319 [Trichinella sp. T6]|nr:hypothetical protein T06_12319 [Trichinella sp. T6]